VVLLIALVAVVSVLLAGIAIYALGADGSGTELPVKTMLFHPRSSM